MLGNGWLVGCVGMCDWVCGIWFGFLFVGFGVGWWFDGVCGVGIGW